MKINFYVLIENRESKHMTKEKICNCNDAHHTGHDYIHYKHIGDQCIHPDGHIHKIGDGS